MPNAATINSILYGTTRFGGSVSCKYGGGRKGCGTVFSVTTKGKERVVYSFKGGIDGAFPSANLIVVNGALYGTTASGGSGYGTVYKISVAGKETVLYRFGGGSTDGAYPVAGPTELNGKLFGTKSEGGVYACDGYPGCGTVFTVTPEGKERVVYNFKSAGNPAASLVSVKGTLYGTTPESVFSLTPSGKETALHALDESVAPLAPLNGSLYGTTKLGGSGCESITAARCGTVFRISPQ